MISAKLPMLLKVGWSVWVAVWIPFYWNYYGPANFLWFCDIGNLIIAVALWRESRLLFSWQAISVLLVQLAMALDMLGRSLLGFHPIGGTEYMWDSGYPLHIRLLSLFHLATPPLLLWAIAKLGYDRRALVVQTGWSWIILPISFSFGPQRDLNWTWGPFDKAQHIFPSGVYLAICMLAYPLFIYLPTHVALSFAARRLETRRRQMGHGTPDSTP